MNTRLKLIRTAKHMSQEEFGKRIGIESRAHISALENGNRTITDRIIKDVCREFDVNEDWLRTGSGEMFVPLTRDEQIEVFMGEVLRDEPGDFRRRLISVLSRLTESEWELLEKKLKEIVGTDEEA